jgi:hypothetical protein
MDYSSLVEVLCGTIDGKACMAAYLNEQVNKRHLLAQQPAQRATGARKATLLGPHIDQIACVDTAQCFAL